MFAHRASNETEPQRRRATLRAPASLFAALALPAALLLGCAEEPEGPPNIVLILLDDADVRDFAFHSPDRSIALPAIEELAAGGLVFDHFYANSPVCSPTRASILTGQYPARYGLSSVVRHDSPRGLPERAPVLAEFLRDRGYATAHVGKWHLGTGEPFQPAARGFQRSVTTGRWRGYFNTPLTIDGTAQPMEPEAHLDARLTDEAIRFVREQGAGPFFLNLWYFTPHIPHQPPQPWRDANSSDASGRYSAQMQHIDHQIGRLMAALDEAGLRERTAVLLLSDNGGSSSVNRSTTAGVTGSKKSVQEGGIRSPLILHWPGRSQPASRTAALAATMDLFPTLVELLGEDPADLPFDGESLARRLDGAVEPRATPLFWEVRPGHADLPSLMNAPGYLRMFAVRDGPWKLATGMRALELYDLEADPGETVDRLAEQPEVAERLLAAYTAWRTRTAAIPTRVAATPDAEGHYPLSAGEPLLVEPDLLHDPADGDLSCRFSLRIAPGGEADRAAVQRIVGKGDAWSLWLDPTNHLELRRDGADALRSEQPLPADGWQDIAVVFADLRNSRLARVFVDGTVAIHSRDKGVLPVDPEALSFGGTGALVGSIANVECFALALTPHDL